MKTEKTWRNWVNQQSMSTEWTGSSNNSSRLSWDLEDPAVATSASALVGWCLPLTLSCSCQTSRQCLRMAAATSISLKIIMWYLSLLHVMIWSKHSQRPFSSRSAFNRTSSGPVSTYGKGAGVPKGRGVWFNTQLVGDLLPGHSHLRLSCQPCPSEGSLEPFNYTSVFSEITHWHLGTHLDNRISQTQNYFSSIPKNKTSFFIFTWSVRPSLDLPAHSPSKWQTIPN